MQPFIIKDSLYFEVIPWSVKNNIFIFVVGHFVINMAKYLLHLGVAESSVIYKLADTEMFYLLFALNK